MFLWCLQFAKQQQWLQEHMNAAKTAQQHAESLGKINAQLMADSAAATANAASMGNMRATGAKPSNDTTTAAATPTATHISRNLPSSQCFATLFAGNGNGMRQWPNMTVLPKQRQSLAQVLLMHTPHAVGVLTASATSPGTASGTSPDSELQDTSYRISVTLRAALTGSVTAAAVLEQLVAVLPSAVSAASKKPQLGRVDGETTGGANSSLPSDVAVIEGKKRLGALWLVLANVLRCSDADDAIDAQSQVYEAAGLNVQADSGSQEPAGASDVMLEQLKRLSMLTGSRCNTKDCCENCPGAANGGDARQNERNVGNSSTRQVPQGVGVSAALAVRWLQAQTDARCATAAVPTSEKPSAKVQLATSVMQPLCQTLWIATHETHALEMMFSVLMFAEVCFSIFDRVSKGVMERYSLCENGALCRA
jgi:hypothetical protein